jgi:hypothetical protein
MTATATASKTTTNNSAEQAANGVNRTAQACCQGANDAFAAGVEANQKLFNTFTNAFTQAWTKGWGAWNTESFAKAIPASFESQFGMACKAMNTIVDANARYVTEGTALMIDAARTNARAIERTGDVIVGQLTSKNVKPVAETSKEIMDETCAFATKVGERVMKMNSDFVQTMSNIAEQTMTNVRTHVSQAGQKVCCNG